MPLSNLTRASLLMKHKVKSIFIIKAALRSEKSFDVALNIENTLGNLWLQST